MKKLLSILFLLVFMASSAYGDELISEQTQDTTPATNDLLLAEKADNSDFIYFTLQEMITAVIGADYDTSAELDALFGAAVELNADSVDNSHINWADIDNLGEEGLLTVQDTADATSFVGLFESATGDLAPKTDAALTYNATSGALTASGFVGPLTGNVTGNASGTAATVTGAAQAAITSVGTLTTLSVDNITINGNDISSTAGTDLTISPLAGQQIVLDSTIVVDAGIVTGATSVTSDAFVGALTGNSSTSTLAATVTIADNESTNENNAVVFLPGGDLDGGNLALESDGTFYYNPSTGTVTATGFAGALTGNVTGNADTVTTNANLTGEVTSIGNATTIADSIAVSSWALTTPTITSGAQFTDANITPDANGELVYDNTVAGIDDGAFSYFGGTDTVYFVPGYAVLPTDSEDDYHLAYDKDTDRMYWKADATAGSPTLDTVGDPAAAWSITAQNTEDITITTQTTATDFFSIDATGAFGDISIAVIEQKTGDPTNGTLLELTTADAEANVDNLLMANGTDDYVTHKIVEAGTYTIDVTSDNTALIALADNTTVTGVMTSTSVSTGAVTASGLITANAGATLATGQALTVGTTQWDDGSDKIDGEQIADNTIDDDSIDFSDVTAADLTLTDAGTITSSGVITGEQLTSTDDADVNDALTVGNLIIDEAVGTIDFTGITSATITSSGFGAIDFGDDNLSTTGIFSAENLASTDDADVVDNLTAGDIVIDEAAGVLDFSGATSGTITASSAGKVSFGDIIDIFSANADPAAEGELLHDSTITGMSGGGLRWYDSGALGVRLLVDLDTDPTDDDYVVAYDIDADKFYMKQDADSGGSPLWNDVGNPDANDEIDFGSYTIQLNVSDFQIGDGGGANIVKFDGSGAIFYDEMTLDFGSSSEWQMEYDDGVDDQLLLYTTKTGTADPGDPMFQILVGTTPTADQDVFEVAKGTQGTNTPLFTVDEDGDVEIAGDATIGSGGDPADSATGINLVNNVGIWWEGAVTDGTDVAGILVDASDIVQIAPSGADGVVITPATTITGALTLSSTLNSVTATELAELETIGDTSIGANDWAQMGRDLSKVDKTNGASQTALSEAEMIANKYVSNQGGSAEEDVLMVAVSYPISVIFSVEEAFIFEICPPSGESFDLNGTVLTADFCIESSAGIGDKAVFSRLQIADASWIWTVDTVRGSWIDGGDSGD